MAGFWSGGSDGAYHQLLGLLLLLLLCCHYFSYIQSVPLWSALKLHRAAFTIFLSRVPPLQLTVHRAARLQQLSANKSLTAPPPHRSLSVATEVKGH